MMNKEERMMKKEKLKCLLSTEFDRLEAGVYSSAREVEKDGSYITAFLNLMDSFNFVCENIYRGLNRVMDDVEYMGKE